jgi:hypothetical protein
MISPSSINHYNIIIIIIIIIITIIIIIIIIDHTTTLIISLYTSPHSLLASKSYRFWWD